MDHDVSFGDKIMRTSLVYIELDAPDQLTLLEGVCLSVIGGCVSLARHTTLTCRSG